MKKYYNLVPLSLPYEMNVCTYINIFAILLQTELNVKKSMYVYIDYIYVCIKKPFMCSYVCMYVHLLLLTFISCVNKFCAQISRLESILCVYV